MSLKLGGLFKGRRTRRAKLEHEKVPIKPRTKLLVRLLLAALILAASVVFFPLTVTFDPPSFQEGSISDEEIIAPFSFEVTKPGQDLELERARAAEEVLPTFVPIHRGLSFETVLDKVDAARSDRERINSVLDSLFVTLSVPTLNLLASPDSGRVLTREARRLLEQARTARLVGEEDTDLLRKYNRIRLNISEEQELLTSQVQDVGRLSDRAWEQGMKQLGARGADAMAELVRALATPNLVYDHAATEAARQAARASVSATRATILKGERIVDANERITAEQVVVLEALQDALLHRSVGTGLRAWLLPFLGRALLVFVFLALGTVFLRSVRPKIWDDLGHLTLMTAVTLLILALAGAIARLPGVHEYLVPLSLAAVVTTLLIGNLSALGLVVALSVLVGAISGWGLPVTLIGAVGGVIAVYSVQNVSHRMGFLSSIVPIALGMILVMLGLHLVGSGTPWSNLLRDMGWLAANAALSIALAMFFLPLFEKIFGLASNITLLELSDLNRPIFKRMMLEANGTYHHSMIVGSLAEAAAEAVGANPLLARVGGYYHDIGKIAKSGYFGENMREGIRNPHEKLTPHMSSLILESHVRDGLEVAREIGLPGDVACFIPEHQGTTLMQYFYEKATELDPEVEERDYRYPGPRPQTKETGLVMLADASEAIVRSLDDHNPKKVRAALARLFEVRISDGQLDDCRLTMADLAKIREAFTHVLIGVFHGRVKYQWQKDGGEDALAETKGSRVFYPELETAIGTRGTPGGFASSSQATRQVRRR
jgi:putative nucleotidyltransferase with HDIG domain